MMACPKGPKRRESTGARRLSADARGPRGIPGRMGVNGFEKIIGREDHIWNPARAHSHWFIQKSVLVSPRPGVKMRIGSPSPEGAQRFNASDV